MRRWTDYLMKDFGGSPRCGTGCLYLC